ncbi:MAG: ATP-binding cassette domain-containing protein [Planctomycetota bacterium]
MSSTSKPRNSSDSEVVIEVREFVAEYEGVRVLDGLDFDVHRGEIFVILGGSGCGKSTLLKHMIGQYEPASGRIAFDGQDLVTARGSERLAILRRLGVSYQNGALFGSMTLLENVRVPLEEFTALPDEAMNWIARMKLERVGLLDFVDHLPNEISGGMQKRAAIARAMALEPDVVFLDEPSAGLDPITSAELDDLIIDLARDLDITFVIVTHELPSVYTIADRVIMLDKRTKSIVATGKPSDLRDHAKDDWVRRFLTRGRDDDASAEIPCSDNSPDRNSS